MASTSNSGLHPNLMGMRSLHELTCPTAPRYFLRVTISRQYQSNIVREQDFWVANLQQEPEINNSIKMEVGIEDCLHIEFEYDKSK
jgi:hypothetical protein